MLKEVKPARYKVLKIIVLLSIQAERKRKDDDDYGDEEKRKCVRHFCRRDEMDWGGFRRNGAGILIKFCSDFVCSTLSAYVSYVAVYRETSELKAVTKISFDQI